MKRKIDSYTFDAANRKVTFKDMDSVKVEGLLMIVNKANGVVIYNFVDPVAQATVSGNVVTLFFDTTLMSSSDPLLIYYDTGEEPVDETMWMLGRMLKAMESLTVVDPAMRQRITVDSGYVFGSAAVALTGFNTPRIDAPGPGASTQYVMPVWSGPIDPRWTNIEQARIAYNLAIRSNISFY